MKSKCKGKAVQRFQPSDVVFFVKFEYEAALNAVLNANSVLSAILAIAEYDEFEFVTFHLINGFNPKMDNPFVRTNYPSAWVSHYLLNNLVRVDPILREATAVAKPFNWAKIKLVEADHDFMQQATQFGVGPSGYSIPITDSIGRCSVVSISTNLPADEWSAFLADQGALLCLLAQDLHAKGVSEATEQKGAPPLLSPREHECLRWTAEGKSYTEIAIILDLSEHTIRSYLKVARIKLTSVTLAQAVSKAARLGLL
jgi:DNA-binding CsgD family transcriptional regulator